MEVPKTVTVKKLKLRNRELGESFEVPGDHLECGYRLFRLLHSGQNGKMVEIDPENGKVINRWM